MFFKIPVVPTDGNSTDETTSLDESAQATGGDHLEVLGSPGRVFIKIPIVPTVYDDSGDQTTSSGELVQAVGGHREVLGSPSRMVFKIPSVQTHPPVDDPNERYSDVLVRAMQGYRAGLVIPSLERAVFDQLSSVRSAFEEKVATWLASDGSLPKFSERRIVMELPLDLGQYDRFLEPARGLAKNLVHAWVSEFLPQEIRFDAVHDVRPGEKIDRWTVTLEIRPKWCALARDFDVAFPQMWPVLERAIRKALDGSSEEKWITVGVDVRRIPSCLGRWARPMTVAKTTAVSPLTGHDFAWMVRRRIQNSVRRWNALLVDSTCETITPGYAHLKLTLSREPGIFEDIDLEDSPIFWK